MTAIQRRTRQWLDEQKQDKEEARSRAEEIFKEAGRIYLPQLELAWRDKEPEERKLERVGLSVEAITFGPKYWAIYSVEQRLIECGFIGNCNRVTGECLDAWVVDKERQSVYLVRELAHEERERQTMILSYIIGSLAADCPRAFQKLKVEVGVGEIRLIEN